MRALSRWTMSLAVVIGVAANEIYWPWPDLKAFQIKVTYQDKTRFAVPHFINGTGNSSVVLVAQESSPPYNPNFKISYGPRDLFFFNGTNPNMSLIWPVQAYLNHTHRSWSFKVPPLDFLEHKFGFAIPFYSYTTPGPIAWPQDYKWSVINGSITHVYLGGKYGVYACYFEFWKSYGIYNPVVLYGHAKKGGGPPGGCHAAKMTQQFVDSASLTVNRPPDG